MRSVRSVVRCRNSPRVLDGDNGLSGEVLDEFDLLIAEWADLLTIDDDDANQIVLFQHRNCQDHGRRRALLETLLHSPLLGRRHREAMVVLQAVAQMESVGLRTGMQLFFGCFAHALRGGGTLSPAPGLRHTQDYCSAGTAKTACSSIAFASAGLPDCCALANVTANTNATIAMRKTG